MSDEIVEVKAPEETFVCEECGREFDSKRGLSIHMNVHEEEVEDGDKEVAKPTPKPAKVIKGQTVVTH